MLFRIGVVSRPSVFSLAKQTSHLVGINAVHRRHPSESWDRYRSRDSVEQVAPFRVAPLDQFDLPRALPCLHRLFSCDGVSDFSVRFGVDQSVEAIATAKGGAFALLMLGNARGKVGGDADIEHAAALVGHNVDPAGHGCEVARG